MPRLAALVVLGVLAIAGCESTTTSEQAIRAAYAEYRGALESQDLTALRGILTAERVPELDAEGAEQTLALAASMSPTGAEIVGITVEADGAEIALSGEAEGATMTGVVRLRRESGAWKVDEEEWSIQVSAGAGAGGSGDFAGRLRTGPGAAPSAALRISAHEGAVTSVAFSPDGATLVTTSYDDQTIRSWDLSSGAEVGMVGCERRPTDMAVARDGIVVVGDVYGNVTRYALRAGELGEAQHVEGAAGGISRIAIDPEGAVIASTGWDDPVRLWDLKSRGNRALARSGGMRGIAFSPDGRWLAAGSHGNTFTVWDLDRRWSPVGRRTHEVSWAAVQSDVWAIAFSPDGSLLATGHMDSSISIWDVKRRKELKNWYVRDASTQDVEFCPDGTLLATAQQDGAVYLWDVGTAQALGKLTGHEGAVTSIAWSPANSEVLASGGEDGTVVVWQ